MIARWHLDLLALSVAVGLVAVVVEARANRHSRSGSDDADERPRGDGIPLDPAPSGASVSPTNGAPEGAARDGGRAGPIGERDGGAVRIPPAAVVGFALLLAGVFDLVAVPALAALTILAGFIGCRRPAVTVAVAALFLAVPAVEGFTLPTWLLVLLALVLLALVPTAHPPSFRLTARLAGTGRVDLATETSAVVPLLVAAALWTAAPDTELPLAAGGALLAPAMRDLLGRRGLRPNAPALRDLLGRRGLRPDAPALMAVTVAAAIGFVGRPAGAAVLALVAPITWISTGPATRLRTGATALSIAALVVACRTGGLRHHVDRALVPTIAAGVFVLALLAALVLVERAGATDHPARQQP